MQIPGPPQSPEGPWGKAVEVPGGPPGDAVGATWKPHSWTWRQSPTVSLLRGQVAQLRGVTQARAFEALLLSCACLRSSVLWGGTSYAIRSDGLLPSQTKALGLLLLLLRAILFSKAALGPSCCAAPSALGVSVLFCVASQHRDRRPQPQPP